MSRYKCNLLLISHIYVKLSPVLQIHDVSKLLMQSSGVIIQCCQEKGCLFSKAASQFTYLVKTSRYFTEC